MDLLDLVKSRRSVRKFTSENLDEETLKKLVEFGRWAPSGLNNQPWKVIGVLKRDVLDALAECTTSGNILKNCTAALVIYLDKTKEYNYAKDCQGIGAFIQNVLLAIHSEGLGACWLGQILNKSNDVDKIMKVDSKRDKMELMAVLAIGKPEKSELEKSGSRKSLNEIFRMSD